MSWHEKISSHHHPRERQQQGKNCWEGPWPRLWDLGRTRGCRQTAKEGTVFCSVNLAWVSLWLWLINKSNSSGLTALPRYHECCPLWAPLFPPPQQSLDPFSHSCLSECAWPSLPYPSVTALIHFQANCFHWCVQTNHLWEMSQDVNFMWNWATAKIASFFII